MFGLTLALAIVALCRPESVAQTPAPTREEKWKQDLNEFAKGFAENQKDFDKLYPRERFGREVAALQASAEGTSDSDLVLALMKLVASAHVGHTVVQPPNGPRGFHRLPLGLYWYSDGLAVTSAAEQYTQALGTRVVRIGSMTPEKLEAAVAPYISYENDVWLHQQSPSFMTIVELLRHLGIASDDGSVEFTMAKPGDKPFTMKISPANPGVRVPLVNVTDAFHIPTPLFRKQPQSYYWYEYLAEQRTLYIQYNRCQDDPQLSFAEFTKKVLDFADAHPVERVIVDLRFNSGGNSNVIKPLENGLKARPALSKYGHLYALMGRATFSSGLLAAVDFRDDLHAILIGEPSGEKPNSYGEIKYLTLPNSKVEVQYSTKFFTIIKNGDPTTFDPDVSVPHSLADALAGRDPALEAALHHPLQ